jgi:hypothetical protein
LSAKGAKMREGKKEKLKMNPALPAFASFAGNAHL